jgi:hypothetical protein
MPADKTPISDPTPPPAPDLTGRDTPDVPNPAADLQPGGFLDQFLEKSGKGLRGDAGELHQNLSKDLKTMRAAMASPRSYLFRYGDPPPERVPGALVHLQNDQYRTDVVLRYGLGERWGIEDGSGKLFSEALARYQEQPDAYDAVLGDLLPASFRQLGRDVLAEKRFDAGSNATAADDWPVYRARLEVRRGRPLLGVSTGLPSLDRALRGLRGLTFLGGGTGAGKSTLALFMAAHALRQHPELGVLYYSLDMPKSVLFDRLLCLEAGVEYADLLADPAASDVRAQLQEADGRLRADVLPRLRIAERLTPPEGRTLAWMMIEDVAQLLGSTGVRDVFVIVDYFQLLPVPDDVPAGLDADFYRVGALQRVQGWSRTNENPAGFPVLAISEVRKGESGRTEISVGDLMGSARLGYSAESVLLLEPAREESDSPAVPVHLKVAKGRDGAVRTQIELSFEHTRSTFREAPRKPKAGIKAKKAAPSQKSGPGDIDPLAGLEG